jgi:hypothetical protein
MLEEHRIIYDLIEDSHKNHSESSRGNCELPYVEGASDYLIQGNTN